MNGLWVVSTENPFTFSRIWDDNRAEKLVLSSPIFGHVTNSDDVHLTLLERLKHLTNEPSQLLKKKKKKKIGVKPCLHTHLTMQMQLESHLNCAMFVSSYRVPTVFWDILKFYLVSFDVYKSTYRNISSLYSGCKWHSYRSPHGKNQCWNVNQSKENLHPISPPPPFD